MNFEHSLDTDDKKEVRKYDVFIDKEPELPIVYLYLGSYFIERGHPYNLLSVFSTKLAIRVVNALKGFRQGASYFIEASMQDASLCFRSESEIENLLGLERLCTLHEEEMQRILESYKLARMEMVRNLIRK